MKTFILTLLTFVVAGAMLLPEPADARRFGGGKSFGRQYSTPAPQRQAQPPQQQQPASGARQQPGAQQRPGGASRWLGPLAGLAAGGLLASLFFGDAFEGFQFLDFLLIAALIFGGVMLFRMMRQRGAGGRPAPAGAGAGPQPHGGVGYGRQDAGGPFAGGGFGGTASVDPSTVGQGADDAPAWFDGAGFVEGAKTHFIRLQAAWDRSDFADIRDYTSPQMYAELKREREALGDAPNDTEVVRLDAELLSVRRDGDEVVASVRFSGLIREEASGAANAMDEVWHVAHRWDSPEGDWIIVGIQQVGQ